MSCDPRNGLVNVGGCVGLVLTRPLMSFYHDPMPRFLRHDEAPPGEKPPPVILPPGPQNAPGFTPVLGVAAATYAPPDLAPGPADLTLGPVRAGL